MSKTYYLRTEPRATSSDLTNGLAARFYDPLWTLGRQWQLGEFLGEDAGTPVNAWLDAETAMVRAYRPHGAQVDSPYDVDSMPLDALVEAGPVRARSEWTLHARIDAGRELLSILDDAGLTAYAAAFLQEFGFERFEDGAREADPASARLVDVAFGRLPDGRKLFTPLRKSVDQGKLPERLAIDAGDTDRVLTAAKTWLRWCAESMFEAGGPGAWRDDTLDYEFSIATSSEAQALRLDAREHRGGALDWHSFDVRPQATPRDFKTLPQVSGVPTGVRYRGMPNARWWEFEDASVDFGSVDAGASDTARLAMLEFALTYANDFFALPLRLPVGSLSRVTSLVVADTFGMKLAVRASAHGAGRQGFARWTMFTLSERDPARPGADGVANLLFLPPVAYQVIAERPVEEAQLLRDEMANLAWAVERRFEGARGVAEDRIEATLRDRPVLPPPDAGQGVRYLLGTSVPEYWFPLLPTNAAGDVRLALARMADRPTSIEPRGSFLTSNTLVLDCAVPREGRRLLRDYAYTRWSNGGTLVWSRRRSTVGRGEGSSGLRFDVVEPE